MRFSFANREAEIGELLQFLDDEASADGDRICLVSGPTGIGKSRLVDEAIRLASVRGRRVRVTIRQSDFRCGESGFFLRSTAIATDHISKTEHWGISLDHYEHLKRGMAVARSALSATTKTVEKIVTGHSEFGKDLGEAWRKGNARLRDLLGEPTTDALRLASDYLEANLSDVSGALIFENAQLFDIESLHFIFALLEKIPSIRLIFEYTTDGGSTVSSAPFQKYNDLLRACLERGFPTIELNIFPINFDTLALKNFQTDDPKFVELLRRELQSRSGNVRDVERLHEVAGKRISAFASLSAKTIEAALAAFSTEQKLVLWIVALSRRSLDPHEINQISMFIPVALRPSAPVDAAKSLIPFVELEDGTFAIDHDSLLERLYSTPSIHRECLVAAGAASAYFRSLLEQADFVQYSEYEILFALLWLSQPLNSTDLMDFAILRLSHRIKSSGRPGSLLRLVHDFAKRWTGHVLHRQSVVRLIKIVYDACWIEGALDLTHAYRNDAPEIRLCYCQALAIVGRHKEAEAELDELPSLTTSMGDSAWIRAQFYAGIVGTFIARVRGDYDIARQRYLAIREIGATGSVDRCLYYRFAEIADMPDAAEKLTSAVEVARNLPTSTTLVRAAISLAMIDAERGRLKEAAALLDEADACHQKSYVDAYMSANNRLVVEMLSKNDSRESYERLWSLLPLVIESMDRLLITNNLMAAAFLSGEIAVATRLQEQLEEQLPRVIEKNMRRLTLFNCARFHNSHGSSEVATRYLEQVFDVDLSFDRGYWQARKDGSSDPKVDFRLTCEFDLPMMSNWYFDWPDFSAKPE